MSRVLVLLLVALLPPLAGVADVEFSLGQLTVPANTLREVEVDDPYLQVPTKDASGRAASAGATDVEPGCYTVTFKLAAPPFGASRAQVDCILDIPGQPQQRRALTGPDFPQDETPLTVTFDAVLAKPSAVRVYVEWSNNQARELPWVRLYGMDVKRRDQGLGITVLRPDKLVYRPGERGKLLVTVRNFTKESADVLLEAKLMSHPGSATALAGVGGSIAADDEQTLQIPFIAGQVQYGCEARVWLTPKDAAAKGLPVYDTRADVFNIADNTFTVGLCAGGIGIMGMSGYCSEESLKRDLERCRATYANWYEKFFWPPDDWGDMTPDREEWISGQSARWEKASMIKAFNAMARANGIACITYGKHGTGGPEGWELTRKHPEWFYRSDQGHIAGQFNTWDLAHWHDITRHVDREGRKAYQSDWWGSMPDFRQPAPLEWGLKELLESSKAYGWDGVRFDGHWTAGNDALSTANMQRLKQAAWAANPHYLFGFNQSWSFGYQTSSTASGMVAGYDHELRESLAGGGMYMQEAINHWGYGMAGTQKYTSWQEYATQEILAADGVRKLGGSYHMIYALSRPELTPVDRLYKFVLGTAAGAHPVYGGHAEAPGCANWGRFLTRWSGLVWDMALRPAPAGSVAVTAAAPAWWQEWAKERIVDARTRQVIVHLINPPTHDAIGAKDVLLPKPLTNVAVRVTAPAGQQLARVLLLDPTAGDAPRELAGKAAGGRVDVTVPQVSVWSMVVVEFTGKFTVPAAPPRFTEAPDPKLVEEGRTGAAKAMGFDPLRPDDHGQVKQHVWNFETDSGYNSVPARGIADPDALNGVAQVRDTGEKSTYIGRTWMGPLPAGRYVGRMRIKLEGPGKQSMNMRLLIHGIIDKNIGFATAEYGRTDEAHTLIADGKYHDYSIEFECPKDGLAPCFIGGAYTEAPDENRLLMDRILIEQLERYTDAQLALKNPLQPPAGLRVGGEPGLDVLVVKGWTWDTYHLGAVLPLLAGAERITERWSGTGEAIGFPQTYEELFKYDVVVLCNVGAYGLQYEGRAVLKDFVEAGGGLVVLGGLYTLGQGNMAGTYFDELLPVTLGAGGEVERAPAPLILKAGTGAPAFGALPWAGGPAVYWRHRVTPKPGAATPLLAGADPALVTAAVGKGRVAVFTLTALGDKVGHDTPFWQWAGWPALLGNTITWAAGQ